MVAVLITPPHVVTFISCASALLVGISTGMVVIMAGSLLAIIAGMMVLGVVVDVDTAGPAVLVELGVLEGSAVSSKAGLAGRSGGCRDGTRLGSGDSG